jgi:hypothetical protein
VFFTRLVIPGEAAGRDPEPRNKNKNRDENAADWPHFFTVDFWIPARGRG